MKVLLLTALACACSSTKSIGAEAAAAPSSSGRTKFVSKK